MPTPNAVSPVHGEPVVEVKVVSRKGSNALIEWYEGLDFKRSWLPLAALRFSADGKTAVCQHPEEGAPYGLPFAAIIGQVTIDPVDIERLLHRAGIWTLPDLEKNVNKVASVIATVAGAEVRTLISRAAAWLTTNNEE